MRRRLLGILVLCLLLFGAAAGETAGESDGAAENLLVNPSFEEVGANGLPIGWSEDRWSYEIGVTYQEIVKAGPDGGNCAMIENVVSNDARFVQEVAVEPETCYRLSGRIRAEGCDPERVGANLSVTDSYTEFPYFLDTGGEWRDLVCYFRTDASMRSVTVAARLGGYSSDTTGRVWFDDLSLTRIDDEALPQEAVLLQLAPIAVRAAQEIDPADRFSGPGALTLLLCAAFAAVIVYSGFSCTQPAGRKIRLAIILLAAGALRVLLAVSTVGYETDVNCFFVWARTVAQTGPSRFYETVGFCDYPPGYILLLYPVGLLLNLTGAVNVHSVLSLLILKAVPIAADLAAVWLLWRLGGRKLRMPAIYALLPAVWVDSALWGQVDAVLALGLLAAFALAERRRWRGAIPVFVLTVLLKPQALMAAPVGAVMLIADLRRDPRGLRGVLAGLGIAVGAAAVVVLPFAWGKPASWILDQYAQTLSSYPYATINTANLWYLLGLNWISLEGTFLGISYGVWGTAATVLVVLLPVLILTLRPGKGQAALCGAMLFAGIYCFGVKMHERYLFPALALLGLAWLFRKDRRILAAQICMSLTMAANCLWVLAETHLPLGVSPAAAVLAVLNIGAFGLTVWTALDPRTITGPEREQPAHGTVRHIEPGPMRFFGRKPARMERGDWIAMLGLTLVYALVAFIGVGSTVAPQTDWTSTGASETVEFDLGEEREFRILYYGGITSQGFSVRISSDGENWSAPHEAQMSEGLCFRWLYLTQAYYDASGEPYSWASEPTEFSGRWVQLIPDGPGLTLFEVVFRTPEGEAIEGVTARSFGAREENAGDPSRLTDESAAMPDKPSYFNGTYFDEIYHARTGYEHAHGLHTYEWTHPPLGKVFIMLGIRIFGMTAFGCRFFGTLAGVAMVPVMYRMGKLLFRRRRWAFLAAFLMAFDMMHLTQTRIATIDSYAVLFIMLMTLCMLRWLQMDLLRDRWRTLVPLGLSGLFMGLGCASKWICFYAAVGLAVLFFFGMTRYFLRWREDKRRGDPSAEEFPKLAAGTFLFCVGVFVVVPALIYYFSYIPHFAAEGGLTWSRFWQTQQSILRYHTGLVDDHAFKSPWYEWPLCLKPMYYYDGRGYAPEGWTATIMCMGNPAVWWVGFAAVIWSAVRLVSGLIRREKDRDAVPLLLFIALAAQFVPWMLVPRSTFIYHYFASLPFVMLLTVYAFRELKVPPLAERIYMGVTVLLFIGFYPFATGTEFPRAWADAMNWLRFLYLPGWKYRGWLYY